MSQFMCPSMFFVIWVKWSVQIVEMLLGQAIDNVMFRRL